MIENWCMLHIPHVVMQLCYNLVAEVEKAA